ncbi:MAG: hypothetical protein GXP55_26425 [Deltaproteobacteria bacterium]|nr:hypothetical protein [Deltaproteobacteria bacterium]
MDSSRRFAVLPLLLALACSGSGGPLPPADASGLDSGADAGAADGSAADAGRDASTRADGGLDGAARDAASADASAMGDGGGDAGPSDGGLSDGGLLDATLSDAAVTDGAVDAGPVDAGPVSMPCTPVGACDPFDPTACADGEKCRVTATGTACQALTRTPALSEGATCTSDTDCAAGTWCVSFGADFICTATCAAGSIGQCGADATCLGRVGAETCVRVCRPIPVRCDIFAQDCADAADACTLTRNSETRERYTGCLPDGTQARGEACGGSAGRCARGTICINMSGSTTCRQVCGADGGAPTCSAAGEACTGLARSWGVPYCR